MAAIWAASAAARVDGAARRQAENLGRGRAVAAGRPVAWPRSRPRPAARPAAPSPPRPRRAGPPAAASQRPVRDRVAVRVAHHDDQRTGPPPRPAAASATAARSPGRGAGARPRGRCRRAARVRAPTAPRRPRCSTAAPAATTTAGAAAGGSAGHARGPPGGGQPHVAAPWPGRGRGPVDLPGLASARIRPGPPPAQSRAARGPGRSSATRAAASSSRAPGSLPDRTASISAVAHGQVASAGPGRGRSTAGQCRP